MTRAAYTRFVSGAYRQASCSHCQRREPVGPCPSCHEMVCAACAESLERCGSPRVREWRLGWGWRLRQVDATGRCAVADRVASKTRFLSLDAGTWIDFEAQSTFDDRDLTEPAFLPSGAIAFELRDRSSAQQSSWLSRGFAIYDSEGTLVAEIPMASWVHRRPTIAPDGWHALRTLSNEEVALVELREPYRLRAFTVLPRRVVQSVAFDARSSLLAAASWGELAVYAIEGDVCRLCHHEKIGSGDVPWLGLARERLVAISQKASGTELLAFDLDADGRLVREREVHPLPRYLGCASLSDSGRFVAFAEDSSDIGIVDLDTGFYQVLAGHTDTPCLVSFTAGSRLLVTADCDNRVRLWPFSSDGPAFGGDVASGRVLDVEKPDEPDEALAADEPVAEVAESPADRPTGPPPQSLLTISLTKPPESS